MSRSDIEHRLSRLERKVRRLQEGASEGVFCRHCGSYVLNRKTVAEDGWVYGWESSMRVCERCMDKHAPANAARYKVTKLSATEAQKVLECVEKVKDASNKE